MRSFALLVSPLPLRAYSLAPHPIPGSPHPSQAPCCQGYPYPVPALAQSPTLIRREDKSRAATQRLVEVIIQESGVTKALLTLAHRSPIVALWWPYRGPIVALPLP